MKWLLVIVFLFAVSDTAEVKKHKPEHRLLEQQIIFHGNVKDFKGKVDSVDAKVDSLLILIEELKKKK